MEEGVDSILMVRMAGILLVNYEQNGRAGVEHLGEPVLASWQPWVLLKADGSKQ